MQFLLFAHCKCKQLNSDEAYKELLRNKKKTKTFDLNILCKGTEKCPCNRYLYPSLNTFCPCCVQKKSIKGVLLHLNENRHPKGKDENPHLV